MIDFFNINKYQSVNENILYISMNLYELLERPYDIDKLFQKYSKQNNIELSLNLERLLFLSLTFLFSTELIELKNNLIRRKK